MKINHVSFTINKRMLLLCSDWSVVSFPIGVGDGGGGAQPLHLVSDLADST